MLNQSERGSDGGSARFVSLPGKVWVPTLAALVFVGVFVALGVWQLNRAEEKRALQVEYDRRALQPPMLLGSDVRAAEALQFSPVTARGVYEAEYQVLLDRPHRGAPGFHVVTPLRIAGGETRVLVNRGWTAAGTDRSRLPDVTPPGGEVEVRGVAVVPHVGFQLGEPSPLDAERPAVWQHLDLQRYALVTGHTLQPVVILLDPRSGEGYVREWARLDAGIAVHQGYAFQWFMLATTVVVIYVVVVARARLRKKREIK